MMIDLFSLFARRLDNRARTVGWIGLGQNGIKE